MSAWSSLDPASMRARSSGLSWKGFGAVWGDGDGVGVAGAAGAWAWSQAAGSTARDASTRTRRDRSMRLILNRLQSFPLTPRASRPHCSAAGQIGYPAERALIGARESLSASRACPDVSTDALWPRENTRGLPS